MGTIVELCPSKTAAIQSRSQVGESFAMSASNLAGQESPAMLAGVSSIHECQESRFCRIASRPVSQCDEEDATRPPPPRVSKTSNSKSVHHNTGKSDCEITKKDRSASG